MTASTVLQCACADTTAQIKQLRYLHYFIQEIMRLRPPTPATAREASQNCTVDGVYIPKGTGIYIPNRAVNMDKSVWGPDADEFKPERWADLPAEYDSTFSMMTFIAGPHKCIGMSMSIQVRTSAQSTVKRARL